MTRTKPFSEIVKGITSKSRVELIKAHISNGNMKVPFYIFNMNSATDCPSLGNERCQAGSKCYALKAEQLYPNVRPFRRRQETIWKHSTAEEIATALMEHHAKRRKKVKKVFRFSESGDFRSQRDINKMAMISLILISNGWTVYGYTTRTDLDLSKLIDIGVFINVSNDDNGWIENGCNKFDIVDEPSGNNFVCGGDCRTCAVCRKVRGKVIEVIKH